MSTTLKRWRRVYRKGQCADCGWIRNVTRITFWVSGMKYIVCADCINAYRGVITTKNTDTDIWEKAQS